MNWLASELVNDVGRYRFRAVTHLDATQGSMLIHAVAGFTRCAMTEIAELSVLIDKHKPISRPIFEFRLWRFNPSTAD